MNKKMLSAVLFTGLILTSGMAWAQVTSSGTLGVTAELASSITLTFNTDTNGVTLGGSGTNTATLDFGHVSQFTAPPAKVTQTLGGSSFTVSTPFDVLVTKSNMTSANYALTAELNSPDAVNSWMIDTFPLTTVPAAATSLTVTGVYGSDVLHTLFLSIPFSEGATTISNTINFVATAN
jgi:hypothetical protein